MTLLFHIHEPLIRRYTITLDIVTRILCTLLFHVLTSPLHIFTGIHAINYFCIPVAWIHCSYYMDYCYMNIPVFLLHDCFPLLILILMLLDMSVVDMRCVKLSAT